jgi:ubiquinone/menaquinone biosynthesis C-methylase UbiE
MDEYDESTYGERIADVYDEMYPEAEKAAVDLLFELADGDRVLELGIGSGRIALPLHQRGAASTSRCTADMIDRPLAGATPTGTGAASSETRGAARWPAM